jgi:hypothetical protein
MSTLQISLLKSQIYKRYGNVRISWLLCYGDVRFILCLFQTKVGKDGQSLRLFSLGVVWVLNPKQSYYHRQRYGMYGSPILVH